MLPPLNLTLEEASEAISKLEKACEAARCEGRRALLPLFQSRRRPDGPALPRHSSTGWTPRPARHPRRRPRPQDGPQGLAPGQGRRRRAGQGPRPGDDLREELDPHPLQFDAAIRQLGGASIIATASDMQLGRGETIEDTAKVLSRMVDAVMIRANSHEDVERFARVSTVPVINGLTDRAHPCQILADLLTIEEHRGPSPARRSPGSATATMSATASCMRRRNWAST
jgi:hypothetical protein